MQFYEISPTSLIENKNKIINPILHIVKKEYHMDQMLVKAVLTMGKSSPLLLFFFRIHNCAPLC